MIQAYRQPARWRRRYQNLHPELVLDRTLRSKYVYFAVVSVLLLFYAVWFRHNHLPTPKTKNEMKSDSTQFIEELALFSLKQLTAFGPKVFGSYANDVLAVEFLKREVAYLMTQSSSVNMIEYDLQLSSGCYYLNLNPYGIVNCYKDAQNVIARIKSDISTGSALLFNCHFDSVPQSPGSSDDGLNCAVMLEILRVLSQSSEPLKNDVIFLFNGAEETPLQASHGFVTQHRWAKDVKAVINLEACGAGGREILFQAAQNHPWLLNMYAISVPHPHALVVAEDIFQSGMVPSDTDFRIFRDFGNIPGLDFAHSSNGYVYHTKFDNLDSIPNGTIQHTGDNLLALVKTIGSSEVLQDLDKHTGGRTVFFDILGLIMIVYSEDVGFYMNIITALLSIFFQLKLLSHIGPGFRYTLSAKLLFVSCMVTMCGWFAGTLWMLVTAVILDIFDVTMSWFSHPSLVFTLYFCPLIGSSIYFYSSFQSPLMGWLKALDRAQLFTVGVQFIFSSLLLMGTFLGIRSSFVLMLVILFPTLSTIVLTLNRKLHSFNIWIATYFVAGIFGIIFVLYLTVLAFDLFIPITGRMGSTKNPELFIGGLSVMMCVLITGLFVPLIVLVKNPQRFFYQFAGLYLLTLLALMSTPLAFPYSGDPENPTPQRILIHHTQQKFHQFDGTPYYEDSGFWIIYLDHHNPGVLKEIIPDFAKATNVGPLCEEALFCGLPMYTPRFLPLSNYTLWIPTEDPVLHVPSTVKLMEESRLDNGLVHMKLHVTGPSRVEVYISPKSHVNLTDWSFTTPVPDGEPMWNNRSTYFIHFTSSDTQLEFDFSLLLQVEPQEEKTETVDIAVVGHYMTNHEYSKGFKAFLDKFPDWAHTTAITSIYASWKF